jgi:hypothetical protein
MLFYVIYGSFELQIHWFHAFAEANANATAAKPAIA